ncbi:MAG: cob(I)yrinic acid a,c-diamide adenosyltransferase [Candidatus Aenigmarchaeota archaeon]|nr:cob(I)yrinic acid a,c-diamide adenosyltransferase [Candidatus Aenigmarchaeota archaeon]
MIQVYTGNGKGKTTAAIGLGIRAVGAGKNVLMIQFLKTNDSSELNVLRKLDNFEVRTFGRKGFFLPKKKLDENPSLREHFKEFSNVDYELVREGFNLAKESVNEYEIIILDEFNLVLNYDMIPLEEVLNFLKNADKNTEIIITGRYAPKEIIEVADLVTNFEEIKHYYTQGKGMRKGIEF